MTYTVKTEPFNAHPATGYHNSRCTIIFEETQHGWFTEEGQKDIAEHIRAFYAPRNMWCYGVRKEAKNVWSFEYGYDSGD